jgi:hypothetical protein
MRLYLIAVTMALASVITIIGACMLHESSTRAVPAWIAFFN